VTNQTRLESKLAEKIRFPSALQQLSEYELKELRHRILSLQIDLQRIPPFDDELVEEVISTQGLLNRWHDAVERILAVKQRKATYNELCNWDNEGGRSSAYPYLPYADELDMRNRVSA
jgi:hypothetical protein